MSLLTRLRNAENAKSGDKISIMNIVQHQTKLSWNPKWTIAKFASEADAKAGNAYETVVIDGNIALNDGINNLFTVLCSAGGEKYDNAGSLLGVGDSTTAEDPTQTDLQATTNKLFKVMNVGYPTFGTSQKATWQADFGPDEANFAWNEFGVKTSTSSILLNRKVSAHGTKTAGDVWKLSLEITIS
jgi:hypothetical protein